MGIAFSNPARGAGDGGARVKVERRLYLTEDRSRVVGQGHPDARWLWAPEGAEVSRAEAERLGALEPPAPPVEKETTPGPQAQRRRGRPPGSKNRPKPADKARAAGGDK